MYLHDHKQYNALSNALMLDKFRTHCVSAFAMLHVRSCDIVQRHIKRVILLTACDLYIIMYDIEAYYEIYIVHSIFVRSFGSNYSFS